MTNEIIGGQALIEGIMMINGNKKAIAVRNPKEHIIVKKDSFNTPNSKIAKLPFIRGIVTLLFMVINGIKAVGYSSNIAFGEKEEETSNFNIFLLVFGTFFLVLLFFKFFPLLITKFFVSKSSFLQANNFIPNIIDGLLKISFFIFYFWFISFSNDTKRIFEYHGAEHKTIRCHEARKKLTPKNAQKFSRFHPRCGTAFIFGVFLISVFVFSIIPFNETAFLKNFFLRILLLPVVMGISYEVLRLSGKNENNIFFKIITAPGLWMQRLTTKEPDEKQLEVAIKALEKVL